MKISAQELCELLNGQLTGDPSTIVTGPAPIEEASKGSVSFIANPKYESFAESTQASVLIVSRDMEFKNGVRPTVIRVDDPYSSFSKVLLHFNGHAHQPTGVESEAYIDAAADVGSDVYIGAFSYIGADAVVGDGSKVFPLSYIGAGAKVGVGTVVHSGVSIYPKCEVGSHCIIHSGTVIGSDGFGFAPQQDGRLQKVPQTGNVIVEDDVEIGANTTIDRAVMGSTIIHKGTKIDNLVQIAHNVEVGEHTAIAAQAGVSGSVTIGKHNMIGGQAGFVGHITLADGTQVNAQSGVTKSVKKKGEQLMGSPAVDIKKHYHSLAMMYRLPELLKRIEELEKALKQR